MVYVSRDQVALRAIVVRQSRDNGQEIPVVLVLHQDLKGLANVLITPRAAQYNPLSCRTEMETIVPV